MVDVAKMILVCGAVVVAACVVVLLFIMPVAWCCNHATTPAELASIEQLRRDVAKVEAITSEDVIGQVTATNQLIEARRAYSRLWWSGWAIPDVWETVQTIEPNTTAEAE